MTFRKLSLSSRLSCLGALVVALPTTAAAQTAYSIDAEFVRPAFGADSFSGVDVATTTKPMTVRLGSMLMYTRNPVTLWDRLADEELGAIVGNRFSLMSGVSLDLSDRLTLNAMVPVAINGSGDEGDPKDFEAPGIGLQDVGIGARLTAIRSKNQKFNMGIKAGILFPSGREQAYLGDAGFRPHGGLLTSLLVGRTLFATEIGVMGRLSKEQITEDLDLQSELNANVAVRHKLPDATRMGVTGQFLSKVGFADFLNGGGENGAEALVGLQVYPSRLVTVDAQVGRGFTQGYATTDLRAILGVTVEWAPREEVPIPPITPPPLTVPDPPPAIVEDPPPPQEETELLIIKEDSIEVKQRLEFKVGTTTLLDSSRPTLRDLADFVNNSETAWRIRNLEIVGHASAEGSYEYNYNLSQGRARTIWQELIQLGVHPDRIAYKGMGEVVPRDAAKLGRELTEEEMQDNRRVEFNIIRKYGPLEENPFEGFESTVKAPWNGEPIRVVVPEKPVEEPEPEQPDIFEDGSFDLDELDEGMEE